MIHKTPPASARFTTEDEKLRRHLSKAAADMRHLASGGTAVHLRSNALIHGITLPQDVVVFLAACLDYCASEPGALAYAPGRLVTAREAAELVGKSRQTIHAWFKAGLIPPATDRRPLRYRVEDVLKAVEQFSPDTV